MSHINMDSFLAFKSNQIIFPSSLSLYFIDTRFHSACFFFKDLFIYFGSISHNINFFLPIVRLEVKRSFDNHTKENLVFFLCSSTFILVTTFTRSTKPHTPFKLET